MTQVYRYFDITRQAAHQARRRAMDQAVCCRMVIDIVMEVRVDHPMMGLRKIYWMMTPRFMGRDRFEATARAAGLGIHCPAPTIRTTTSQKTVIFPNRVKGLILKEMHQLWVTDITYFHLPDRFAYIISIMDVYTRLILAAIANLTLSADANIHALRLAIRRTNAERCMIETIHHSDRGSQYIDKDYLALLEQQHFLPSMCEEAWENPYVERVQGTLKNEYLVARSIGTLADLRRELSRVVRLYNTVRPHQSLPRYMTPQAYKEWTDQLPAEDRPNMRLDNTPSASRRTIPAGRVASSSSAAPAPRPPDAVALT